jgi:hypothetical protein
VAEWVSWRVVSKRKAKPRNLAHRDMSLYLKMTVRDRRRDSLLGFLDDVNNDCPEKNHFEEFDNNS